MPHLPHLERISVNLVNPKPKGAASYAIAFSALGPSLSPIAAAAVPDRLSSSIRLTTHGETTLPVTWDQHAAVEWPISFGKNP